MDSKQLSFSSSDSSGHAKLEWFDDNETTGNGKDESKTQQLAALAQGTIVSAAAEPAALTLYDVNRPRYARPGSVLARCVQYNDLLNSGDVHGAAAFGQQFLPPVQISYVLFDGPDAGTIGVHDDLLYMDQYESTFQYIGEQFGEEDDEFMSAASPDSFSCRSPETKEQHHLREQPTGCNVDHSSRSCGPSPSERSAATTSPSKPPILRAVLANRSTREQRLRSSPSFQVSFQSSDGGYTDQQDAPYPNVILDVHELVQVNSPENSRTRPSAVLPSKDDGEEVIMLEAEAVDSTALVNPVRQQPAAPTMAWVALGDGDAHNNSSASRPAVGSISRKVGTTPSWRSTRRERSTSPTHDNSLILPDPVEEKLTLRALRMRFPPIHAVIFPEHTTEKDTRNAAPSGYQTQRDESPRRRGPLASMRTIEQDMMPEQRWVDAPQPPLAVLSPYALPLQRTSSRHIMPGMTSRR
jgi:hypothetical protein